MVSQQIDAGAKGAAAATPGGAALKVAIVGFGTSLSYQAREWSSSATIIVCFFRWTVSFFV